MEQAKEEFSKYLPVVPVEAVHGRAKVKAIYEIGGVDSTIAGLQVLDGTLYKDKTTNKKGESLNCQYRVFRNNQLISSLNGEEQGIYASTLKHFKEDVDEVGRGKECGLSLTDYSDFQEGDEIECFSIEMKREFI